MAHEVHERIRELLPNFRKRAPEADELRRLPVETVAELRESGLMRMLQPKRYGGYEADPRDFYNCLLDIAAADGSTGWVCGVVGVHPWEIALGDDRLQAEIWGDDPDMWVASTYMPGGMMTAVDGGYRLTGRWSYSSGSDHCGWVILGTMERAADGSVGPGRQAVLPRADYVIEDVWDTMGLRGTGSNDIIVEDVFVPYYRTIGPEIYVGGGAGREVNTGPLYQLTFGALFANVITTPIIGMAQGMLDESLAFYRTRVSAAHGKALDKDPYTIAKIAEAAREIDACRLLLMRDLGEMYESALAGEPVTMDQRARTRRDQVLNTKRALAAIDDLFDRAGASAISNANPMQRIFRDAHAARHHTANTPMEPALFSYTHNAMGLGPVGDPLT